MSAPISSSDPTPSSSPPVTPSSISKLSPILDILSKSLLLSDKLKSISSADRSSMCELKRGLPCNSKCFSLWPTSASTHGISALFAWSVCKITQMPYFSARRCTWWAAETVPSTLASKLSSKPKPAKNCPPLFENWIIISELFFAAASIAELIEFVPTTLTAGRAYSPFFAALTSFK